VTNEKCAIIGLGSNKDLQRPAIMIYCKGSLHLVDIAFEISKE